MTARIIQRILAPLARFWRWWFNEITKVEDPRLLALFRMGIALSGFSLVLSAVTHGIVELGWLDKADGGYRDLYDGSWLFSLFGGPKPALVWSFIALSLLFNFFLFIGFLGKLSAFFALQFTMALINLNSEITSGASNLLLTNALWLLALSRSTTTWSLDCWLKNRSWTSKELVPAFVRYLAIFQILLCYFMTGIQKASIHWLPGTGWSALYYIMQQPPWQRFDHSWMAWVYPLTQMATFVVWFWEVLTPLWLLALWRAATSKNELKRRIANNIRCVFMFIGVVFHLGIYVFMDIGIFPLVSLAYYPCLLLIGDLEKIRARFARIMRPLIKRA